MGQQIYEWMRNLAVFYIFLTVVLHLVPNETYEGYLRFFMGLLLILMLLSPLLEMMNLKKEAENLIQQYAQQEQKLEQQMEDFSVGESPLDEYIRQEISGEGGTAP